MEILSKRIDKATSEVIDKNLIMDMIEQQITSLIYEEEVFIKSISSTCPTSLLACC